MFMVAFLMVPAIGGCKPGGIERVVVTGQVTYNGKPVEVGIIRFAPQAGSGLPVSAGRIEDGRYTADTRGGVPVGTHRIEITSYIAADGSKVENLLSTTTATRQLLPQQFNRKSDMMREILAEDPFTLDFDLRD